MGVSSLARSGRAAGGPLQQLAAPEPMLRPPGCRHIIAGAQRLVAVCLQGPTHATAALFFRHLRSGPRLCKASKCSRVKGGTWLGQLRKRLEEEGVAQGSTFQNTPLPQTALSTQGNGRGNLWGYGEAGV